MLRRIIRAGIFGFMAGLSGLCAAQDPGVAVLDSGTNDTSVNVVDGFNFFNGTNDTSDPTADGHGTTVSQIIDLEAPGVPQYQYVVTDADLMSSPSATDAAVLKAASNSGVNIIAFTAATISTPSTAIPTASQAGKFIAIRAGDEGSDNPGVAAVAASGLSGVAVVVATDGSGTLLPTSNSCGAAAARCVAVRGTTGLSSDSGTSIATARMAGIAAAVLKAAPFLSSEQLAQVIFATADKTGDTRLGNGFVLNADQVINSPAGPTSIPDGSGGGGGGGAGIAAAALILGGAAGAAVLLHGHGKLEKTMVLDSYGRPFQVDLTRLARIDDRRGSISSFFDSLEERQGAASIPFGEHATLDAAYTTSDANVVPGKYFAFKDDPAFADPETNWTFSLTGDYSSGFHYQLNRNRDPSLGFGIMRSVSKDARISGSRFLSGQSFSLPLLGFGSSADSVKLGFAGREGFGVDFGLVDTNENRAYGRDSVAAVVEGSYKFHDRGEVTVQVGHLRENGSLFGGSAGGAFGVDSTNTLAGSVSASLRIGARTRLVGDYGIARSDVNQADASLLKNFSTVSSNWFGLGLVADEVFHRGDQLGVAVSQPLRVTRGQVDLQVPYARDLAGNIYTSDQRVSLVPNGTEYALESYYLRDLGRRSSVGAYFMLRSQPDNVAGAGPDVTVLASYRAKF
ncbi:MAG: S8 family serine peptidase [Arenicellales bacterium]